MSEGESSGSGVPAPERCPICETAYESVSTHEEGVAVNLIENERFRRVCFEPLSESEGALLRFYHPPHEQAGTRPSSERGTAGGRVP